MKLIFYTSYFFIYFLKYISGLYIVNLSQIQKNYLKLKIKKYNFFQKMKFKHFRPSKSNFQIRINTMRFYGLEFDS